MRADSVSPMSEPRTTVVEQAHGVERLRSACADAGAGEVVAVLGAFELPEGCVAELLGAKAGPGTGTVSCLALPGGEDAPRERLAELGRPRALEAPLPTCVLLPRSAIELAGVPEEPVADVAAFVAAFAERCTARGLVHLLAPTVVAGTDQDVAEAFDERVPAGHVAAWARRVAHGLSVTIDARSLTGGGAGTQVHTLELIGAVAARDGLRVRVVLPPEPTDDVLGPLSAVPRVELRTYDEVVNAGIVTDVVHRPFQVFTVHDLRLLQRLGRRIVVTQQDQLLYRNPSYFPSVEAWQDFRHVSRSALAWADRAVFFTEHARREALRDELLEPEQAVVVPIGTDHPLLHGGVAPEPPAGVEGDAPFLLVLGSDLGHKNRPFALRLLRALREDHGWDGRLVLAGPRAEHGSLRDEEDALLADGDLPAVVLDRVSESERAWLMDHCAAVVFPSVEEGFGLLPFEAGEAGKPCLFAPLGALVELLGPEAATLVPWDVAASAAATVDLLTDSPGRERHVRLLREASSRFTWEAAGERLEALYDEVLRNPPRAVAQMAAVDADRQAEYQEFRRGVGEDALSLVGPSGSLPVELQRPLLAVSSHPVLRRPLFASLKLLYRFGRRE
jgi:glycosyltransferase involved in cell wall biosynthesis